MLKPNFDLLNKKQLKTLEVLKQLSLNNSILGGGTALMLQLAHRRSYDLDVFGSKLISQKFLHRLKQHFRAIEILVDTGEELSFVFVPQGVKVSFIYYPYSPLYKIIPTPYIKVFSWKDIALDKAYTIGRRGEWRDYVDLYFAMKQGFSLGEIIKKARRKFRDVFSEKLFLAQLVYFADLKDLALDFIEKKYGQQEIKNFFQKEVEKYKDRLI